MKDEPLVFAKNSHYANFQRDRRKSGWKKAFFATIDVKWTIWDVPFKIRHGLKLMVPDFFDFFYVILLL
jgi:hypothetical protein